MTALLTAMNACLSGVSLSPVSDENDSDLDASQARTTIERISREIQQRGWYFNEEPNWNMAPDSSTGQIVAPANALSMITEGQSRGLQLVMRAGKIYDMINHTYDLTDIANYEVGGVLTIQMTFTIYLEFNDLPPTAQKAIMYTARRQFAQDLEVDDSRWKFQKQEEVDAMYALEVEDSRNRKRNQIYDNPNVQAFLAKAGGYNAYSRRLDVFPRRNTY
jgi:hypothetical protein